MLQRHFPIMTCPQKDTEAPEYKWIKVETDISTFAIKLEADNTLDWLDDVICVGSESAKVVDCPPREEVKAYMNEPALDHKDDALTWWMTKKQIYSTLSSLATKYLCFPASSVSSEQIFSLAGNIVTKKRSLLQSDTIDMLIFFHKNK